MKSQLKENKKNQQFFTQETLMYIFFSFFFSSRNTILDLSIRVTTRRFLDHSIIQDIFLRLFPESFYLPCSLSDWTIACCIDNVRNTYGCVFLLLFISFLAKFYDIKCRSFMDHLVEILLSKVAMLHYPVLLLKEIEWVYPHSINLKYLSFK